MSTTIGHAQEIIRSPITRPLRMSQKVAAERGQIFTSSWGYCLCWASLFPILVSFSHQHVRPSLLEEVSPPDFGSYAMTGSIWTSVKVDGYQARTLYQVQKTPLSIAAVGYYAVFHVLLLLYAKVQWLRFKQLLCDVTLAITVSVW